MCTVTFIPVKDKFYITSNRDEKSLRKHAILPKSYMHNDFTLVYPKDTDADGTWIAMRHDGNAAVLLNGAFEKHVSMPPYRQSRGKVFLDIIATELPVKTFLKIDLLNIEPFTLIILHDKTLSECRWNGEKKFCKQLQSDQPYIWSSATLYSKEIIKKREQWFTEWLANNPVFTQENILNFHRFSGDGDRRNDLFMNRDDKMCTVSITGIELTDTVSKMFYLDFKGNTNCCIKLNFTFAKK
jgi:uncharacterized protein with NRDE domain